MRGLEAFRGGDFHEAHEEWEVVWRGSAGPFRRHLQGLIQVAAALVHLRAGRPAPAGRLLALALEKLWDAPEDLQGVPVGRIAGSARGLLSALAAGRAPTGDDLSLSPPGPP